MHEVNINIANHRAHQISNELMRDSDLILVMESGQRRELTARYPEARPKTYQLGEWGDFESLIQTACRVLCSSRLCN